MHHFVVLQLRALRQRSNTPKLFDMKKTRPIPFFSVADPKNFVLKSQDSGGKAG